MFNRAIIFFVSLVLASECYGKGDNIGKYMKTCKRNTPETNKCLVDAVRAVLPLLCEGIPDFNYPPIDPYRQEKLKFEYNNNQISMKMRMSDITVFGLRNSQVHNARLRADEDRFHLEVDMSSPKITVKGKYEASGTFNALKLEAHGTYIAIMSDLVYTWKLDGEPITKDGDTYIRINSFYMRPDVSNLNGSLTNDNPETRSLTDFAASFALQNWKPLYRELVPIAVEDWNKTGTEFANKIFLNVPYVELFPPGN